MLKLRAGLDNFMMSLFCVAYERKLEAKNLDNKQEDHTSERERDVKSLVVLNLSSG